MTKEWMNPDKFHKDDEKRSLMFLRHLRAYEYVKDFVKDKNVLEIGCGSGYGSKFLSQYAKSITTVDLDNDSLEYAKKNNNNNNIEYIHANILNGINKEDQTYDIAISFQVIEHIDPKDSEKYLNEIKRLLKPDTLIIITTPNRKFRLYPFQKPKNKYHKIEYTPIQIYKLLNKHFRDVRITAVRSNKVIEAIEKKRVKTSLYHYIILLPIKRLLFTIGKTFKIRFISRFFEKRNVKTTKKTQSPSAENSYNVTDFYITDKNLGKGIDLIATCKN